MPLVTVKCRETWYPTSPSGLVYELAEALPLLLTQEGEALLLDEGTPPNAVQVDFQKFDSLSRNIPDVWILILFTEDEANHTQQELEDVRDMIIERISGWIRYRGVGKFAMGRGLEGRPEIALDIFWGPGHGCMMDPHGTITMSW